MIRECGLDVGPFRLGEALPSLAAFLQAVDDGWLDTKTITTADGQRYMLFNYSRHAQYERHWTPVTLVARGLIINITTGEVVAAPLTKFFNLGEQLGDGVVACALPGAYEALLKMDGSLGIGYRADGEFRWATRGSFDSPQARVAQNIWNTRYQHNNPLLLGELNYVTPMVEIIHPVTRVVCRYQFEDLVLHSVRDRFTGRDLPYEEVAAIGQRLGIRVVERIESHNLEDILTIAEGLDDNQEGFVLRWQTGLTLTLNGNNLTWGSGYRVKAKGKKYKELHRLLSNVTPWRLAQEWYLGTIRELLMLMPEEFRQESEQVVNELDAALLESVRNTEEVYSQAPLSDQKDFAAWVRTNASCVRGFLFTRRQQDNMGFAGKLANDTLASLIKAGRLNELLESVEDTEAVATIATYEQTIGNFLWEKTRDRFGRARLAGKVQSLPKALCTRLANTITALQPALVVEALKAFIAREDQRAAFETLDVDAMFAQAPDPESPIELHNQWVLAQPLSLRSFLDRWRECGRKETATKAARALLADAVRIGAVTELLTELLPYDSNTKSLISSLTAMLTKMASELAVVWEAMPHVGEPQALVEATSTLGARQSWGVTLLNEVWSAHREAVRDRYVAEKKELPFADRFEDS